VTQPLIGDHDCDDEPDPKIGVELQRIRHDGCRLSLRAFDCKQSVFLAR
jgi:hypothetical protein